MFTKRTIKPHKAVDTVDTASEALAVSISEKSLCRYGVYGGVDDRKTGDELADELQGVIFRVPGQLEKDGTPHYVTADEYLSGNVRRKLRQAQAAAQQDPSFAVNVEAPYRCPAQRPGCGRRLRCAWALPGSTKSTSSSLCMRPSTRRFISSAISRSTILLSHAEVADHRQKLCKPEQCGSLYHLRNQPCQCLQDSGGQPEPAGCPYLRHHIGMQTAKSAGC